MSARIDLSALAQEVVTGGVLFGSASDVLVAQPDRGYRRVFHNKGQHPLSVRRCAENFLRRLVCAPNLPQCCVTCGADITTHSGYTCSACRKDRRANADPVNWDVLTPDEQAERLAALRAKWDAEHVNSGDTVPVPTKLWHTSTSSGRDLHAGLELAERLIREKGGDVPLDTGRAVIADAHQRALARRQASALAETA